MHRKNVNHERSLIQSVVNQLIAWGHTVGLTFQPTKTVCILFTKATERALKYPHWKLHNNGEEVESSLHIRYVGIQILSKLTWSLHLNMVIKKVKQ